MRAFADLFAQFRLSIYAIARQYYAPGNDEDDLLQEATIGFFFAIRDYDATQSAFASFVRLCVRRRLITLVKSAARRKHSALNGAVSLDARPDDDPDRLPLIERLASPYKYFRDPGEAADDVLITALAAGCSQVERAVLTMQVVGLSPGETAEALNMKEKAVTNALWRMRVKARKIGARHCRRD
jgi:RNA polymerase sporulation-specific sigma factor